MNIFSKRPLFTACMFFLLASIVSFFMGPIFKIILMAISGIIFIVSLVIGLLQAKKHNTKYACLCTVLSSFMILLSVSSSFIHFNLQAKSYEEYYGKENTVEAVVISENYEKTAFSGYTLSVISVNGREHRHKATLDCEYLAALDVGDVIIINAIALEPENMGERYNEKITMLSDGIFVTYRSTEDHTLVVTDKEIFDINFLLTNINLKMSRILTNTIGGEAGNVCSALLLGNRNLISDSTARDFTRAGASHILALSGMHMSIIMGALMYILKRLIKKIQVTAVILSICAVFYLALTGFSVSATRSVIMLLIVYLSIIIYATPDPLTSLSVAGFLIVLASPGAVLDAAFWMSFAATFGMVVFTPPITDSVTDWLYTFDEKFWPALKALRSLITLVCTSFFVLIPLICVLCIFIRQISLFSIISSIVLAIPSYICILSSLLLIPISGVPVVSEVIARIPEMSAKIMIDFCSSISQIDGALVSINYSFAPIFAILLALALLYCFISKHKLKTLSLIPFALCLVMFVSSIFLYEKINENDVKVTYINASSTSDAIVASNGGEAIICDISNGSMSTYNLILDELYNARVTEIRAIILTRYSYAHNSTLPDIFESEMVHELWLPYPIDMDEYDKMCVIYDTASKMGVDVYLYRDGEMIHTMDRVNVDAKRTTIERSVVPISLISIQTTSDRVVYASPAFNESDLSSDAEKMFTKAKYVVFGNKGPKPKTPFTIGNYSRIDAVAFATPQNAAYFVNPDMNGIHMFTVPERIELYIEK